MASRTLKRRLHHRDVDGKNHVHLDTSGSDSPSEPLLENYRHDEGYSEAHDHANYQDLQEGQRKGRPYWTCFFSRFIGQCTQWLSNVIICSGSLLRRCLPLPLITHDRKNSPPFLSSLQEERLRNLQQRLEIPYDGTRLDHQDALRQLWKLAYPSRDLPSLKSEEWKEMGWQSPDPSTDFRYVRMKDQHFLKDNEQGDALIAIDLVFGTNFAVHMRPEMEIPFVGSGGFLSLENLIFFAKMYPDSFQRLLHKQEGKRAEWEYPFAVAGVNISFVLVQMLDLQSGRPTTKAGIRFLELLGEDEMAFDNLYCVAFQMVDVQWLAKRASYMEFNEVIKSTRAQLEHDLTLEDVHSVKDLPAYKLLRR